MPIFATLKHISTYRKTSFFSVVLDGEETSLFEQFIENHGYSNKEEIAVILTNIHNIGNKRGAQSRFFRHEGAAEALPYQRRYIKGEPGNLRLYCSVLSVDVVVLYSGHIKTKAKAQDCPNVSNHFALANLISNGLTEGIKSKDLIIDSNFTHRLIIGEDFELII